MLGFFRKRAEGRGGNREMLLGAVAVHNELVRVSAAGKGLRLVAPLKEAPMRRVFSGSGAAVREKAFELDEIGAWVWRRMDGRRTVEELIGDFARHFRVNAREAEIAVLAFLKTLTQRNLIALAAKKR